MEVTGKIITVLPLQEGTSKAGNPWKSQSYVLETQEQYPKKVCFEVFGEDRIKNNSCQIDEVVTVSFDLESREFNGRWYTSVRAWKIAKGAGSAENNAAAAQTTQPAAAAAPAADPQPKANVQNFESADNSMGESEDNLPF